MTVKKALILTAAISAVFFSSIAGILGYTYGRKTQEEFDTQKIYPVSRWGITQVDSLAIQNGEEIVRQGAGARETCCPGDVRVVNNLGGYESGITWVRKFPGGPDGFTYIHYGDDTLNKGEEAKISVGNFYISFERSRNNPNVEQLVIGVNGDEYNNGKRIVVRKNADFFGNYIKVEGGRNFARWFASAELCLDSYKRAFIDGEFARNK